MSNTHLILLTLMVWGLVAILCRVDRRVTAWTEKQARKSNDRRIERAACTVIAEAERLCRESCNG